MSSQNKGNSWTVERDGDVFYSTHDLGLAAALLCVGCDLMEVDKSSQRAVFVFLNNSRIQEAAHNYFAGKLDVRARSFFDHLKALKSKLYSA
jgi:hypothetical protein